MVQIEFTPVAAGEVAGGEVASPRRRSIVASCEAWLGTLVEIPAALLVLAGCSLAPKYDVPSTPTSSTFKETSNPPTAITLASSFLNRRYNHCRTAGMLASASFPT